ncbi:thiamine pyrophosphate-dependent enzyme [Granulicella rosea]|uniref:thiamine pyrophosphate-dependent enzyme n=1 Tax=Granulicella rosea TaxID=474952 RepID=UPI000B7807FE|nr:thiamine pyrophosphate-dependent enzyme [Granulicella rosea]
MSAKAFENPLIPNQRLRDIYIAMVQTRLLGKRKPRTASIALGREALWAATAIGLRDALGDLVSETGAGVALDIILGAELKKVVSGKAGGSPHRLPTLGKAPERLQLALGAAMALKAAAQKNVLLVYADQADLPRADWRAVLGTALGGELPVVFVVSCEAGASYDLAALSQARGVPGIAVDASDAIALYRVAQESIGRARADGGPALIAAVPFHFGSAKQRQPDPVALLGGQLLRRKVCTQAWLEAVEQKTVAMLAPKLTTA